MRLEKVNVSFNDKIALRSINFSWNKGETIALLGANGVGKSTFLKVISLIIKPSSGQIFLDDYSSTQWKQQLGIVFQESFLYEDLSAYENLEFYQKLYNKYDRNKILELLGQVELSNVKNDVVKGFSKGMKQRLSIARALVHDPLFLLLDEPFDGLDLKSRKILESLLYERKQQGMGWLLVSHDVRHAWELCDHSFLLEKGTISYQQNCSPNRLQEFMNRYEKSLEGYTDVIY